MGHCLVAVELIEYTSPLESIDLDCLSSMQKLQHLAINAWWQNPIACWESKGQLSLLTSLESFRFERGQLNGPVLVALSTLSRLTSIVITPNAEGIRDLSSMAFAALERFAVQDREIDDLVVWPISLCPSKSFSSLRSLSLTGCDVSSWSTPLHSLPSLTHIEFQRCDFASGDWLLDALEGATQVSELFLTALGLDVLPQSVCSMTGLRELGLEYNRISDLPAACVQLCALETLDIACNSFQAVPNVLSCMTHLRNLTIFGCADMKITMPLTFLTSFTNLEYVLLTSDHGWDSTSTSNLDQTATALQEACRDGVLDSMPRLIFSDMSPGSTTAAAAVSEGT